MGENAIVKIRDKDPVKAIIEDRREGMFRKDRKETMNMESKWSSKRKWC